jgi:hypothetical protein
VLQPVLQQPLPHGAAQLEPPHGAAQAEPHGAAHDEVLQQLV